MFRKEDIGDGRVQSDKLDKFVVPKRTTGNFVVLFLFFMMAAIREECLGVTDEAREVRGGRACQCGETYKCEGSGLIIAAQMLLFMVLQ
jgi:hypothetical protein